MCFDANWFSSNFSRIEREVFWESYQNHEGIPLESLHNRVRNAFEWLLYHIKTVSNRIRIESELYDNVSESNSAPEILLNRMKVLKDKITSRPLSIQTGEIRPFVILPSGFCQFSIRSNGLWLIEFGWMIFGQTAFGLMISGQVDSVKWTFTKWHSAKALTFQSNSVCKGFLALQS